MSFTIDSIEKAIKEFYYGAIVTGDAHQWLTAAQISPDAWNFCWDLMDPSKPPEIQFFGANTLQLKISKFWHELPADQYASLRKKLLEYIVIYAVGTKIVLTRLCVALSSYVIHTVSEHWVKAIPDIIAAFQLHSIPHLPAAQILSVLIEILTVIPEEFQSMIMAQSCRGAVRHELKKSTVHVIPVLQQVLSCHCSSELRLQAIKCLSSWIQFGIPLPDCENILSFILESTKDENLCEGALDCLTNIACHQDVHKYSVSLQRLINDILQLEPLLHKCLEEKDFDKCYSINYLFTSVAETHSHLLLENVLHEGQLRDNSLRLVQLVLQCTATPGQFPVEETCSSLAFNFWYMLQDDIVSSDSEKCAVYTSYFVPIYMSLVDFLMMKSILPSEDEYQTWNSDDTEQFRCYRQDIGDTLMYCYNILRESLLQRLFVHLETILSKSNVDDDSWKILEACLFAFESVAESVDLEESIFLPRLFSCLPNIPLSNFKVANTALSTIGAYGEWIHCHPVVLNHIVPLLIMGLGSKEMAPASTRALKEISRDCQQNMKPFAHQILTESQRVLNANILHSNESIRLMSTIGRVLSVIDLHDILSYLTNLLTPCLHQLQELSNVKVTPASQARLLVVLNMLAMLFANLDVKLRINDDDDDDVTVSSITPGIEINSSRQLSSETSSKETSSSSVTPGPQPVLVILQQTMPIIHKVSMVWGRDSAVIEAICDVLKKAISTLLDDCLPLMADILNLMVLLYQTHPRVSVLDLIKQFLLLFGKDENHVGHLRSVFSTIINVTLMLCEKGIAEHTDIVQGFLQILSQVFKKLPMFLLHQDFNLMALFQCGVVALSLPEAPTVKAASSFLVTFISQSPESPLLANVVNEHGEALIEQTLRCIGGEAPRGVIDHISDILLALNKKCFEKLCHWMTTFLHRDGFPSPRLTKEQKEHYIRLILTERANKRKLQETVKEFTLVCRGLMGTEYASEIMLYL